MATAMAPPLTWAQEDYGLDRRLTKACKKAGWVSPTLVQQTAIPLILKGKDVLCRARTGAGKTAAYLLPVMHKIIHAKDRAFDGHDVDEGGTVDHPERG